MEKVKNLKENEIKNEVLIDKEDSAIDKKTTGKKSNSKAGEAYTGWYKWVPTSDEWLDFEADGKLPEYMHILENEYLLVYDESEPNKLNRQYVMKKGKLERIGRSSITIKQCGYGSKNTNKTYMPKNDEQVCAFDLIKDRTSTVKLLTGSYGSGKACPNSTIIPTPSGNKTMGELKVGDYVFDEKGKPTKILGVYPQGKKEVYEITFKDGRKAKCCNEHLWTVYIDDGYNKFEKTINTSKIKEYLSFNNEYCITIPRAKRVSYSRKNIKPQCPPYYFGKQIITTQPIDSEFLSPNIFLEYPELYKNRRIPEEYLLGDIEQRIELFEGLTSHCRYEESGEKTVLISNKNGGENFKNDFLTLCYSLGYIVQCELVETRTGEIIWAVKVQTHRYGSEGIDLDPYLEIKSVEELNYEEEMTCIYVENETHLFLMNDFIVTHNTMLLVAGALELLEHEKFDRIIWIRNNIDVKDTKDLGALPGEVFEKLKPFLGPFIDHAGETRVMSMVQDGRLVVEPLQFLRGRNFENSLILCSEAENLTKEHIQLIIARAAGGSEVWFDGDCRQRDKASFEKSQGLEKMIERFKGNVHFGYIYLPKTERSETAAMADLLD